MHRVSILKVSYISGGVGGCGIFSAFRVTGARVGTIGHKHVQTYAFLANKRLEHSAFSTSALWSIILIFYLFPTVPIPGDSRMSSDGLGLIDDWTFLTTTLLYPPHVAPSSDTNNYEESLTTLSTAFAKYSTFRVFRPAMLIRPFLVM